MSKPAPAKPTSKLTSPLKKPARSVTSGKKGAQTGTGGANEAWTYLTEEDIHEMAKMGMGDIEGIFKYVNKDHSHTSKEGKSDMNAELGGTAMSQDQDLPRTGI